MAVDDQIAVGRDDPDVVFRVAHMVDDFAGAADTIGPPVQLLVDADASGSANYPAEPARKPCGGTHVRRLGEIDRIHVTPTRTEDDSELTLTAHTVTRLAEPPTAPERSPPVGHPAAGPAGRGPLQGRQLPAGQSR